MSIWWCVWLLATMNDVITRVPYSIGERMVNVDVVLDRKLSGLWIKSQWVGFLFGICPVSH